MPESTALLQERDGRVTRPVVFRRPVSVAAPAMDKLKIRGGAPLAGEIAHLRREERGSADHVRGAVDARTTSSSTTCRSCRTLRPRLKLLRQMGVRVERDGGTVRRERVDDRTIRRRPTNW